MVREKYLPYVPEEKVEIPKTPQELRREKWANFWYYYKIPLFVGLFFLSIVLVACEPWAKRVKPDYNVLIASGFILSDENLTEVQDAVTLYGEDLNGDGEVTVQATSYLIEHKVDDFEEAQALDVYMTKLLTDISINKGYIFLCDEICAQWLANEKLFCTMDGNFADIDWSASPEMAAYTLDWREIETFRESNLAKTLPDLDLYFCFRANSGTVKDDAEHYAECRTLMTHMMRNEPFLGENS